jgi:hypothetical protein
VSGASWCWKVPQGEVPSGECASLQVHRLGWLPCLGLAPAASHRRLCGVAAGDTGSLLSLQLLLPLPSLMLHCYLAPARVVSWQAAGKAPLQPVGCIHACMAAQDVGGGGRVWWGTGWATWVVMCCLSGLYINWRSVAQLLHRAGGAGGVPSPSAPLGKQAAQRRPLWVCGIGIRCSLYRAAPWRARVCKSPPSCAAVFVARALQGCSDCLRCWGSKCVFCLLVGWLVHDWGLSSGLPDDGMGALQRCMSWAWAFGVSSSAQGRQDPFLTPTPGLCALHCQWGNCCTFLAAR